MLNRRRPLAVLLAFAAGAACVPPAARPDVEDGSASGLRPTFAATAEPTVQADPEGSPAPSPAPTAGTAPTAGDRPAATPGTTPTTPATDPTEAPAPTAERRTARVSDPTGDVDDPLLGEAPAYADLAGAVLEIAGEEVTLAVEFAEPAPEATGDEHTMNVASFYDLDGDGTIDIEVWANASSSGWGTSWFDNDARAARYAADDDVEVAVESGRLVLRFPSTHLRGARTFRWALASEWGTYEALSTGTMSEDHAPDGGAPATFPG